MQFYHEPVMAEESIYYLNLKKDGIYIDATFGGGGHSRKISNDLSESGKVFGFDQDQEAENRFYEMKDENQKIIFVRDNFSNIKTRMKEYSIESIDGILYDLGVSSKQIDDKEKGFSFMNSETPLNMNLGLSGKNASEILNEYTEDELKRVFKDYSELPKPGLYSRLIVRYREKEKMETSGDLIKSIEHVLPKDKRNKTLAKLFQGIRIEVNDELFHLEESLNSAVELLKPLGRIVVISYHSLEDRIVKRIFQRESKECLCPPDLPICSCSHKKRLEILTRKPISAGEEEIQRNPRARSARLRAAIKMS